MSNTRGRFDKGLYGALLALAWAWVALFHTSACAAAPDKVRLQLKWYHQFQFAGYYAARSEGYYKDERLDVEIIEGAPDKSPERVVLARKAEFGVHDGADLTFRRLQGDSVVALAAIFQHSPYVIISKQSKAIRHPSDLVGRKVLITQDQGSAQILAMFRREGIKVNSTFDEKPVLFVPHSWNVEDLIEDRADAMTAYVTEIARFKRQYDFDAAILNPLDYGIDFYGDTLFTSDEFLKAEPEVVERFRRASLRGWEYAMANPEAIAGVILALPSARQNKPDRQALMDEAQAMDDIVLPKLIEMGNMNDGRWEKMAKTYQELGMASSINNLKGFTYERDTEKRNIQRQVQLLGAFALCVALLAVGSLVWLRVMRSQVRVRTLELTNEVSERQQAEKAMRQSETHYRTMFDSAPEGVWMIGPDRRTTEVNQRMCDLVGYTRDELFGRNPVELADEENSRIFAEKAHIVPSRQTRTYEIALRHRDGHNIQTEFRATNLFNEDGSVMGVLAFVVDLSVRKQAEERLQLAANVFGHAREGITITDAQGIIVDVNDAFSRITGYLREEVLGQSPRILQSGRQDKAFYEAMWRDLIDQGHWSGEIWNQRKDGGVYAQWLTISSVRNADGAVQQYVGLFSDITAIKEHQRQLEHIAHFDALTTLPNRVLLADRLQQAMAQALRRNQQVAVVYLDLDGFKAINDKYGHEVGDQVLVTLAQRMKQVLREGDSLARLGGDEFVAVLIDLEDLPASQPLLNRLLVACAQPVDLEDLSLQVSASLGVTAYPQERDIDADQLLRQADQAMYQAKVAGKNRYHFFDAEQDSSIRGRHESVDRIRLALERHEFVLYYQPKVNMRSGQIIGAEALIRWQHPEKGLLAPAVFLPVIEDHALAVSVGEWVIDTALTQLEIWQAAGLDLGVSVNIGARQLQQSDFVDRLKIILAKHPQVNPTSLELEVLETSALKDIAQVSEVIEACAQIGVTFALDDFGTGYSSLTYLKRLRVAMLKIDQSFVRDMLEDPDDLAILQGIIGLAESFKRQVIAEGVETVAHGSLLLQLGCELAQGYGIARPMSSDQLPAWAASWQPDAAWCALPWLGGLDTEW